jgi:hypothetical protein
VSDGKLMLYVWPKFAPDYTDGLAFAVAESEEQARQLVALVKCYAPEDWGTMLVYPLTRPVAYAVSGGM